MKALVIEEPLKMHLTEIPRPELESGEALILTMPDGFDGEDV